MLRALGIVCTVIVIAVVMLFAVAMRLFKETFLIEKTSERPGDDPFETIIPPEYLGRFRAGKAWLMSPKRPLQPLHVNSRDGLSLAGYLLPAGDEKVFIILVHGYLSSALHDFGPAAKFFYRQGISMLCTDLRAHGASEGHVTSFGANERFDVLSWIDLLLERYGPDIQIFLEGLSMGASTVLMSGEFDLPPQVKGIIADCGFTSPLEIVKYHLKYTYHLQFPPLLWALNLIFRLRTGYRLDACSTLSALNRCQLPVLLIHGDKDDFVPTYMSRQAYETYAHEKQLFIVPEAKHCMSYLVDPRGYIDHLSAFFAKHTT